MVGAEFESSIEIHGILASELLSEADGRVEIVGRAADWVTLAYGHVDGVGREMQLVDGIIAMAVGEVALLRGVEPVQN